MYQIDQSIKIENTSQNTIVAIANDRVQICSISARDKRVLEQLFRKLGKPLIFKIFTFAYLCSKVISLAKPKHLYIDKEYTNHEIDIKNYITQILTINHIAVPEIDFMNIGKASKAHLHAYRTRRHLHLTTKVKYQEVIKKYNQLNQ